MFVELISALRCLTPHEDTWLVAAARRTEGRNIVEGTLGCPVCGREYPIVGGVAYFGAVPPAPPAPAGARSDERWDAPADAPDEALRLAALLDLATPGGIVVLGGGWGRLAPALLDVAPVHCLLVDPDFDARGAGELSVVRSAGAIPIAAGAARGVALDAATAGEKTLAAAVHALQARGRLVAPSDAPPPAGVAELARDESLWVAERAGPPPSAPVSIGRRPRRS